MQILQDAYKAETIDITQFIQQIPYAEFLGMTIDQKGMEITTILPFQDHIVGNPLLPAIHGGVIGAFLEMTAVAELVWQAKPQEMPKPIDINIEYLRSGKPVDTYGRAIITKHGRRVANVQAEAWQDDRSRPIARLHCHFLQPPQTSDEAE